jgi:uncharacterized alkaline shock family protein YloU
MFQLLFLIGWIGIFILSSLGIIYTFTSDKVIECIEFIQKNYSIGGYTLDTDRLFTVIAVFYLFLSIEKFLSMFKSKEFRSYIFKSEKGLIAISYSSIETIIKKIIDDENYVIGRKIKIKEKGKKIILNIKIEIEESYGLTEKTAILQTKIADEIENVLSIKTEEINLKISGIKIKKDEIISTEGE